MIPWHLVFTACIFLLWAFSTPRDRNALRIVLISSLAGIVLVEFVTRQIQAPWKLAIPGAVEVLTISALMLFSPNRTGLLQSLCLLVAWLAHMLCYLDIALETDLVYSRYEAIIQLVAVAQILVCFDTIARCGSAAIAFLGAVRDGGRRGLRVAGLHNSVLRGKAAEVVQAHDGTEKSGRVQS